jgi:hypothetical protein
MENVIPDEDSVEWREITFIIFGFIGAVVGAGALMVLLRGIAF